MIAQQMIMVDIVDIVDKQARIFSYQRYQSIDIIIKLDEGRTRFKAIK